MFSNLPPVTKALIIANGLVFAMQLLLGDATFALFMLWPLGDSGFDPFSPGQSFLPWQLVTHGFLHGSFPHLFFNMLALLMFGAPLEHRWGNRRFLQYYLVCIIGAGFCQLLFSSWQAANGVFGYSVGASGGVYGLILAYGMYFPNERITFFPIPYFFRARTVAILFAATALLYGVFGTRDGIGHFAHLGGMLTGWLLVRYWRKKPPSKRSHLRRVK